MRKVALVIFLVLLSWITAHALPAFPGAEGMGAATAGGRGGTVYIVTNLNDSGAGSFRAACEASGPRYVVFAVSGVINLSSSLIVTNPYITIAGQTSPGGVCTAGYPFRVNTHDVIITHMRFRTGQHGLGQTNPDDVHGLEVWGSSSSTTCYNVILDHVSVSFGIDENVDVAYGVQDLTFSRCLIARPLYAAGHSEGNNHDMNMVLWGKNNTDQMRVTIHHCYFGTAYHRDPEWGYDVFCDIRNNVAYNMYGGYSPQGDSYYDASYHLRNEYSYANYVANYYKRGPLSNPAVYNLSLTTNLSPVQSLYVSGNIGGTGVYRDEPTDPEWCVGQDWHAPPSYTRSTEWQSATPFSTAGVYSTSIPVTTTTMTAEYAATIVADAGANKCAFGDCQDTLDAAVVAEFVTGTGGRFAASNLSYPTGWPVYSTAADNPTDSDSDGMWDTIEVTVFGSLAKTGTADTDGDGYTDFEEYLFYIAATGTSLTNASIVNGGIR